MDANDPDFILSFLTAFTKTVGAVKVMTMILRCALTSHAATILQLGVEYMAQRRTRRRVTAI